MPSRFIERIGKQSHFVITLEAILLAVVIGLADYLTGYEVSLFVFYAIPIAFAVWFANRRAAIAVCGVCVIAWGIADAKSGHQYPGLVTHLWNITVQIGFFILAMISAAAVKFRVEENQAKLRRLERFQLLARISPVAIFRADRAGHCLFTNQRWSEMTGQRDIVARELSWLEAVHADDRERVRREWAESQRFPRDFEFEARFADAGRLTWGYGRVAPEADTATGEETYVGAVMDMTAHRRLEQEVLLISEREQQRIGLDLHDDLCQFLTAIQYTAASAVKDLSDKALPEAGEVGEVNDLLKQAVRRTRGLARTIFPVRLEENGLVSALQELAATASRAYGITCRLESADAVSISDSASATHLYRIAQEAMANAVRHGHATAVTFTLDRQQEWITLAVADNGAGFPVETFEISDGMGLHIMRYRSHMIGGSLAIQSTSAGVRVTCTIRQPSTLPDPAAAAALAEI